MDFFNDPRNEAKLKAVRDLGRSDIPENRVPQYYPLGVYEVFGVRGRFQWGAHWDEIIKELDRGRAVQLCLKDPGHYIAVVAYEDQAPNNLVYHDSWGSRFPDGRGGFNRRLSNHQLRTNVQPFMIVYGV